MRIDATVFLEIKDTNKNIEIHIADVASGSVNDVVVTAFRNGWWSGHSPGNGTFYPASRLYSARTVYRNHCGHETCTKPYSEERDSFVVPKTDAKAHVHTLPEKEKKKGKPTEKKGVK